MQIVYEENSFFIDCYCEVCFNCLMLTQRDLDEIEKVVEEKIEEKTRNLPSKDDFFTAIDEVMDELKTIRENQEVLTNRVYEDHESRIKRLEKKLQISSSNF